MPAVSVIVPTYNRATLLPRAVESAKNAASTVNVIVIDDASSDETPAVCAQLEGIAYRRLPTNGGLNAARNAGLEMCSTEFVAFLDDDDILLPGKLDVLAAALLQHPSAALAYGKVFLGDDDCTPTGIMTPDRCPSGDLFWILLEHNFLAVHSVLIRRSCLEAVGGFEPQFREDGHLWLKLTERYPAIGVDIPVGVYRRSQSGTDQMTANVENMCRATLAAHRWALQLPRAASAPRHVRRAAQIRQLNQASDVLILDAAESINRGLKRRARRNLLLALRLRPMRAARPWTFRLLWSSL